MRGKLFSIVFLFLLLVSLMSGSVIATTITCDGPYEAETGTIITYQGDCGDGEIKGLCYFPSICGTYTLASPNGQAMCDGTHPNCVIRDIDGVDYCTDSQQILDLIASCAAIPYPQTKDYCNSQNCQLTKPCEECENVEGTLFISDPLQCTEFVDGKCTYCDSNTCKLKSRFPEETNCNNDRDDDNDGFKDMADKDCYKQIDLFDINGPVSFNMGEVYGTTSDESGFKDYWISFSHNGSDGVCGDDDHTGICVFNNSITCEDQTNIYQCMDLGCTPNDVSFSGTPSNYYCNLNPTDLEHCYSSKVCDDSVAYACNDIKFNARSYQYPYHSAIDEIPYFKNFCAVDQTNSRYVQKNVLNLSHLTKADAQSFCNSILNAEFKENYDWLGDVFKYACINVIHRFYIKPSFLWDSLETCYDEAREPFRKIEFPLPREGTCSEVTDLRQAEYLGCKPDSFNCIDMPTYSECAYRTTETCNGFCEWQGIEDFENDLGYISQGGRYFCNKDYFNQEIMFFSDLNSFHWWDAANYENAYKIHNSNGIDFISNGAEWYYCAANNTQDPRPILQGKTNAKPISEGETFSLPQSNEGYTCVEFLNAVAFNEATNWKTCINFTFNNITGDYECLQSDEENVCEPKAELANGAIIPLSFSNPSFEDFIAVCGPSCYLSAIEEDLDEYQDLALTQFCEKFPFISLYCPDIDDPSFGSELSLLLKKNCTGQGLTTNDCLDINNAVLPQNCNDIHLNIDGITYNGTECSDKTDFATYCNFGSVLSTTKNSMCCMVEEDELNEYGDDICGYISNQDLSENTCYLIGGSWISAVDYQNVPVSNCVGGIDYSNEFGHCCVGGDWGLDWMDIGDLISLSKPESFVCYKHNDLRLISECCSDFAPCNNYYSNHISPDDYYYYGLGGAVHTIENYDKFKKDETTDNEFLLDYISKAEVSDDGTSIVTFSSSMRPQKDISSFQYLEFDVALAINEPNIYLEFSDMSEPSNICKISLQNKLVTGTSSLRWHHAVINLDLLNACSGFDKTNVDALKIKTITPEGSDNDVEYKALFDAFVLSGGDNSPNYYCTGNFGSWVTDLDGPSGSESFSNNSKFNDVGNVEGYGKYWYACEAQAAFDWTGRKCCGDDTVTQFKLGNQAGGEYYADIKQGCFHGVPIPSGKPVSYSFNNESLNNIIFYNGEFYGCQLSPATYTYKISYDGQPGTQPLVTTSKDEFDVIGDYICFEQNWINKNKVEVSKILLAKMYDLTFSKDDEIQYDFEIMCDETGDIATFKSDSDVNTIINSMCVLRLKVDDEIYTVTGLNFNAEGNKDSTKTDAEYFMEKLIPDLEYSKEFTGEQRDSLKTACDYNLSDEKISAFSINPTKFFQTCSHDETSYRFAYNPSLNIIFIVDTEELGLPSGTNLQDLMSTRGFGEFIRELWDSFLGLFTDWFGGGDSAGDGILDYAAYMPTFQEDFVQFDKVYLAKFSNATHEKHIKALMETREDFSSESIIKPDMYFVSVEYQGFGTQVQKLAENYYNNNDYAMDYAYGSDGTQLISLVLKENNLKKYSYQNNFDWKRLTSGLMVNPDVDLGWSATSLSGNCQIDLGEECDTCENGSLIPEANYNCNIYSRYVAGNISCTSGVLNYTTCIPRITCEDNVDCIIGESSCQEGYCYDVDSKYIYFKNATLTNGSFKDIVLYCVDEDGICLEDFFNINCENEDPDCEG
ncbi:MAG: hypothetical protein PHU51_01380 [Candidatus Nanoarchaeia archaeon]|nr:hypothetical protein [Candidatus Nanoarchaeia archaeon]